MTTGVGLCGGSKQTALTCGPGEIYVRADELAHLRSVARPRRSTSSASPPTARSSSSSSEEQLTPNDHELSNDIYEWSEAKAERGRTGNAEADLARRPRRSRQHRRLPRLRGRRNAAPSRSSSPRRPTAATRSCRAASAATATPTPPSPRKPAKSTSTRRSSWKRNRGHPEQREPLRLSRRARAAGGGADPGAGLHPRPGLPVLQRRPDRADGHLAGRQAHGLRHRRAGDRLRQRRASPRCTPTKRDRGRSPAPPACPNGEAPAFDVFGSQNGLFMTDDGRAFFYTEQALVPQDTNRGEDVYEFAEGRPQLITAGTGAGYATEIRDHRRGHLTGPDRRERERHRRLLRHL